MLISPSNHCIKDDCKIGEFSSSFTSLSVKVDGREREMMTSSGFKCEACLFHFKGIKGERGCI